MQSLASQPKSHAHTPVAASHAPCEEHSGSPGQRLSSHPLPFQPSSQVQTPSLHAPWPEHCSGHVLSSQNSPCQYSKHSHLPPLSWPWPEQRW